MCSCMLTMCTVVLVHNRSTVLSVSSMSVVPFLCSSCLFSPPNHTYFLPSSSLPLSFPSSPFPSPSLSSSSLFPLPPGPPSSSTQWLEPGRGQSRSACLRSFLPVSRSAGHPVPSNLHPHRYISQGECVLHHFSLLHMALGCTK